MYYIIHLCHYIEYSMPNSRSASMWLCY